LVVSLKDALSQFTTHYECEIENPFLLDWICCTFHTISVRISGHSLCSNILQSNSWKSLYTYFHGYFSIFFIVHCLIYIQTRCISLSDLTNFSIFDIVLTQY
jgi:hypothetical protein